MQTFAYSTDGVLEVYRITLLSNYIRFVKAKWSCFRGLQNYTTLKPQIKFEAQE